MKIKFFKKEKNFKKDKESLWLNMNFSWELALSFMFVVVIVASFFGYYLFVQINKESVLPEGGVVSQTKIVKKERIEEVLKYFSERKQKSDQIIISPAPVVDPSL